ncbi:A1pp-domain-containing protein [Exidia glandulosa HHB12029]|uniref:A1pp-domain-containing protein n=1 Tax=Exidia glandulosa HHB12029 TaxID=1314781 RepID=A0A165IYW0_EXIGL|nr:A1pp-domain-containing protein [Exidia glandulosa HHB12029]
MARRHNDAYRVTAIVNAANEQLMGCFQPQHRCIDNVIHSAAGPRLRSACYELMAAQDHRPERNGHAKLTPGYALSAQWVLHTVGPQLRPGQEPSEREKDDLRSCYLSCLDAVEKLPPFPDGRLVIAFPCISTGLFCFPADLAARIAVTAVESWCASHPTTTLTDVVFDVFSDADEQHYEGALAEALNSGQLAKCAQDAAPAPTRLSLSSSLRTARDWLEHADYIVISAGAGLSAATGLDYTSTSLFRTYFPAFIPLGLRRLYDVFGNAAWPSPGHKWGYYFKHLNMVRSWPSSLLYTSLLSFVTARFGDDYFFIRTSNADGLFFANGFPEDRVSTPQGAYKYLQCMRNCRPDAFFPSAAFLAAALPHLDPVTQVLTDTSKIPRCTYCGSELFLCVRAGNWFNELPYAEGETRYRNFLKRVEQEGASLLVLELGVGMNTPSVLRWPNEDMARAGDGRVKLVRVGKEAAGVVDFDLVDEGLAIGIDGDVADVVDTLIA